MKKPILLFSLIATFLFGLFTQCDKTNNDSYHFQFEFITEEYKPFNYMDKGTLTGLAPDVLEEICKRLHIPYDVKILSWSEGYDMAQNTDNAVLFSTILNAERKDMFKWAGPLATLDYYFYSNSQNDFGLSTMGEAKEAGSIGVIKDYAIEQYLLRQGFTNLVYCSNQQDGFSKLLNCEIDLFPSDKISAAAVMETLGQSIYTVTARLSILTDLIYFAFNQQVPDDVVADFQHEIDMIKAEGILRTLSQKYLNSSDFPGVLQIYTEQYPPLTFRNNFGEITGFGSDIVYEIMKRNQLYNEIKLAPWSNGYELALNNPNVCLFTMDRTELREDLFQWVGPIGTNTTWFYTKNGSGITINSIEEAKSLDRVGTVSSWFSGQYLVELGFTNLIAGSDPNVMTEKLMSGEIDVFVCTDVTYPDILKSLGYQYSDVEPVFSLMSSDYYISFSNGTSETLVTQWQTTLDQIKSDGTYQAISNKWFRQ